MRNTRVTRSRQHCPLLQLTGQEARLCVMESPSSPSGHARLATGGWVSNPRAPSSAAADLNTTRSPCCGPINCKPTGIPWEVNPIHTVAAGDRVILNGYVNLIQLMSGVPLISTETPSAWGG